MPSLITWVHHLGGGSHQVGTTDDCDRSSQDRGWMQAIHGGEEEYGLQPSLSSFEKKWPTTNRLFNDKMSLWASYITLLKSGYENKWHYERMASAVPIHTVKKPQRNRSALSYKLEYLPTVPSVIVIKAVNKLISDVVDYRNFRLINRWTQNDDEVGNKLSKMRKKPTVKMKNWIFSSKAPVRITTFCNNSRQHATHATFMWGQLRRSLRTS